MAINVSFNGATIYKPGAYSKVSIDLGGGFPLSPTGIVAIFGEATAGEPGDQEQNIADNVFSPEQLPTIREKYKSGPIVDAANFLFAPASDGAIPSGTQALYIFKTNSSLRASLNIEQNGSHVDFGTVQAREWGLGGNVMTYKNEITSEVGPVITGVDIPGSAQIEIGTVGAIFGAVVDGDFLVITAQDGTVYAIAIDTTGLAAQAPTSSVYTNADYKNYVDFSGDLGSAAAMIIKLMSSFNALGSGLNNFAQKITLANNDPNLTITQIVAGDVVKPVHYAFNSVVADSSTGFGNYAVTQEGQDFNPTTVANKKFKIAVDGGKPVEINVLTSGVGNDYDSAAKIAALIDAALTGASLNVGCAASSDGQKIVFTHDADASAHIRGWGKAVELIQSVTPTVKASLTINGDITFEAVNAGHEGNDISIAYISDGTVTAGNEEVEVSGNAIVIKMEASASTSTQIYDAVLASSEASALVSATLVDPGQAQAAAAAANLVGGTDDLYTLGLVEGITYSSVEAQSSITINQTRDLLVESDTIGGNIVMSIGYNLDPSVSATVTIDDKYVYLKVNGTTTHADAKTFRKASYSTVSQLVNAINMETNWTAQVTDSLYNVLSVDWLDFVTDVNVISVNGNLHGRIKKDAAEMREFFDLSLLSKLASYDYDTEPNLYVGLADARGEIALSGGVEGGTLSSDVVEALTSFTKFRVNAVVPLFSRDSADDIADSLTDATSTYTIDGIHQAVKTHLSLMSTTKRKSERQGYLSFKDTFVNCKSKAGDLSDARLQLCIQDVRQIDAAGSIKWFQPWALSCLIAGSRMGSPIGTPLTFKYMNCSGIRHTSQSMSTAEEDIIVDFDPDLQYDEAIQAGITFLEAPQTGGYRVVVDNTTYGKDGNWVYNRGNVLYAADVLAYDFRNQMENIYTGAKNTVTAAEVKSTASSVLSTYLAQGITVSTSDAQNGFKDLIVRIVGNTIYITVTVKLVEGIDFILADITLQRAQSAA